MTDAPALSVAELDEIERRAKGDHARLYGFVDAVSAKKLLALLAMARRTAEVEAERDRLKCLVANFVDQGTYGNSYGVEGSDFDCCHYCQGGGAPGVQLVHEDHCPIGKAQREGERWWQELTAETERAEAAEAEAARLREQVARLREAAKGVTLAAWTDRWGRLHGHACLAPLEAVLAETAPDAPADRPDRYAAGMEEAAKIAEAQPEMVLTFWDRPGGPPGNGYTPTNPATIAAAIRAAIPALGETDTTDGGRG